MLTWSKHFPKRETYHSALRPSHLCSVEDCRRDSPAGYTLRSYTESCLHCRALRERIYIAEDKEMTKRWLQSSHPISVALNDLFTQHMVELALLLNEAIHLVAHNASETGVSKPEMWLQKSVDETTASPWQQGTGQDTPLPHDLY